MLPLLQTALPPSNLPYLIAAFLVAGLGFLAYIFFIFRRRQETRKEIARLLSETNEDETAGPEQL